MRNFIRALIGTRKADPNRLMSMDLNFDPETGVKRIQAAWGQGTVTIVAGAETVFSEPLSPEDKKKALEDISVSIDTMAQQDGIPISAKPLLNQAAASLRQEASAMVSVDFPYAGFRS